MLKVTDEIQKSEGVSLNCNSFSYLFSKIRDIVECSSDELCECLNSINNQGIEKVDIQARTYVQRGKTFSIDYEMGTAEKMFLITKLYTIADKSLVVYDYTDQLSLRVSNVYIDMFCDFDITLVYRDRFSSMYVAWRNRHNNDDNK